MATKSIAWNTGTGNITLTYQGQGDGSITVASDANDTGSSRSQVVTVETVGDAVTKNLTITQAACPFPVGDVRSYSYTGSYQEVELPAGQYKLQCWGAQGGSNAAASSYSITAKAGGKGGYSEGIITLSQKTTVRVYVGGQGSSSTGGYNGGGSTTGSSSYSSGDEQGVSRMGGGGGATDIRLSDGALLSRMIVAGGGSGGAMCYKKVTTTVTSWQLNGTYTNPVFANYGSVADYGFHNSTNVLTVGKKYKITVSNIPSPQRVIYSSNGSYISLYFSGTSVEFTCSSVQSSHLSVRTTNTTQQSGATLYLYEEVTSTSTTTSNESQVGYVGGGTNGGAYSSTYAGKQNTAGSGGAFGQGANQTTTNYRYCSGAGGGGWYGGGGGQYNDNNMTYCKYSGGGSGFVNTAANAKYRPSGYTGLQLDSGTTKAGNTSFPNTSGTGNETGHSGNGYAKITRLS